MSVYTPDCWAIIKVTHKELSHYRVLCSWAGSYIYGSSWKISSGIETFKDNGDYWFSDQTSGSTYKLYKTAERMSGIMAGIFETYASQSNENMKMEHVNLETFLKDFNGKTESI